MINLIYLNETGNNFDIYPNFIVIIKKRYHCYYQTRHRKDFHKNYTETNYFIARLKPRFHLKFKIFI